MALDFSWTNRVDNVDDVLAADVNAMAAAIIETQTKLGATVYGSLDDVATRLVGVISAAGKLSLSDGTTLTISSGAVTSTKNYHAIETEAAAASDDLDTINGGTTNGQVLIIRPVNAAHNVVIKHNTGNVICKGEVDITLEYASDLAILVYDTNLTKWLGFGYNSPVEGTGTATYMADWYNANTVKSSGILTADVMKLSVYDTDADGIVDEAAAIEGIATAGNSKYYGTSGAGAAGFHDIPNTGISVSEVDATPTVTGVTSIIVTNGTLTDNNNGSVTLDFGSAATDGAAIHDNTASEISAITEKTTLSANDMFIIEDSAAGNAKKMVKASTVTIGHMELITDVLLTGTVANFDFTSIPGTYKHLLIIGQLRTDRTGAAADGVAIRFNNDSGATQYAYQRTQWKNDTAYAESTGVSMGQLSFIIPATNATANYFGQIKIEIGNYSEATVYKTAFAESHAVLAASAASMYTSVGGVTWKSTSAITRVTIIPVNGPNFISGSRLTLYGLN